jgi:hypothetical protein
MVALATPEENIAGRAKGVASLFLILLKSQTTIQSNLLLPSNALTIPGGGNTLCFKYAVNENK